MRLRPLLLALPPVMTALLPGAAPAQTAAPDRPAQVAEATTDLPDWQHTSINDFAGLLTPADTRALDEALIALHDQTGVEGTVVTLSDRARHGGADGLEPFATRLFNHWGVGDATRNDGFMVLVLPDDREARIELGRGYPREADILAQDITSRAMLPAFRKGDYSRGLRDGTLAVIDRIARPHSAGQAIDAPESQGGPIDGLVVFAATAAGAFGLAAWNRRRRNRCPNCGHRGLESSGTPLHERRPDGGWRTAVQTRTRRCPACGWEHSAVEPLPFITEYDHLGQRESVQRVSGTDGGSSGFGGGSSSGGGASGRW